MKLHVRAKKELLLICQRVCQLICLLWLQAEVANERAVCLSLLEKQLHLPAAGQPGDQNHALQLELWQVQGD